MSSVDLFNASRASSEPIPGLTVVRNVISQAEEADLILAIDASENWSSAMRRRVQHYGFRYDYRSRTIDSSMTASPFPQWLTKLAQQFMTRGFIEDMPDQAIVNEYVPGQGIYKHVDCEPCFGPEIASVSLGSACEMLFTHIHTKQVFSLFLEPKTLLRLTGSARYEWMHGIPARRADVIGDVRIARKRRLSITFRKVIIS